jgi:hypothetical protein
MSGEQESEADVGALVPHIPWDDSVPEELAAAGSGSSPGAAAESHAVSSTAGGGPVGGKTSSLAS